MSDEDRTFPHEAFGADAAAYALGALEPAEAEAFERHLKQCHSCAEDVTRFKRVVDQLAISPPQYGVPPGLRRRVMANVRSEPRHRRASRARPSPSPTALVSRAWPPRPALAGAMVLGLALAVLAIVTLVSGGSSKLRVLTARVVDSSGTAQVRLSDGRAELIVRHFPAPAAGRIYEVWLKRPGRSLEPTTALFNVSAQGAADIRVPDPLNGVSDIMVSEEPAGGSVIPTHQPVIVGQLS
jgi:anti-sigma-K factor RskA